MKAVVIVLDSLNRHFLPCYGNDWVRTPNIDRLASRSVIFDNHYLGSAPCMPARRDMLTGRLSFLERDWGGLEPFDVALPQVLGSAGVHSHVETDHYHYFEGGGEFYHTCFDSWRTYRGQEWDKWSGEVDRPAEPAHLGKWKDQYELNRRRFAADADYPTPKTFAGAVEWLADNRSADDWLLWVEGFDPHEPFDCPQEFLDAYGDDWSGPLYNWSGYDHVEEDSPATRHLRNCYAATLTMADKWLGRLLDELDRQGRFDDTLIYFTTDHGHLLGEHGSTGKNRFPLWNELARIPLLVHLPGGAHAGQRRDQLTQNVDLLPTLAEHFGADVAHAVHGRSLLDVARDNAPAKRDAAIYGWFAHQVGATDGRWTYLRAPATPANTPLNSYLLMPTIFHGRMPVSRLANAEFGRFLPWTDTPVLRVPERRTMDPGDERLTTRLYDLAADPHQQRDLAGTDAEDTCRDMLVEAMRAADSPPEQFERLGLA